MSRSLLLGLIGSLSLAVAACVGTTDGSSTFGDAGVDSSTMVHIEDPEAGGDSPGPISFGGDASQQDAPTERCTPNGCDGGPGFCGDGILQPPEACDDGNSAPGDGCSGTCQVEPGWACPAAGVACVKIWVCGNSHIDPGENCDDGNAVGGDGCSATCMIEPGYACPNHNGVGGPCVKINAEVCGNGVVAGTEQCDDGNTVSGDGCSSTCMLEAGWTCPVAGQTCKHIKFCGNGILDLVEQCDDGNMVSGDGCSATCKVEPNFVCPTPGQPCVSTVKCGDGKVQGNETCDDGNTLPGDGCSATCQVEPGWTCPTPGAKCVDKACGDGIIAGGEQCDDGNVLSGDGCSATCQLEPGFACVTRAAVPQSVCHQTSCGDGIKEGSEQCDDGNLIPYDGCSPTCTIEPKCNGMGQCTAVCGDGLVEPPEQCDLGARNGPGSGCDAACKLDPSSGWYCSNVNQPAPAQLVIPILYRDMLYWNTTIPGPGHPDFNCGPGHCVVAPPLTGNPDRVSTGEVNTLLGADGKPVFASVGNPQTLTDPVSFCWWYHGAGCGGGAANPYSKLVYLDLAGNPTTLVLTQGASGTYTYANKQFFPIDGLGWNAGANAQTDLDCESQFTAGAPAPALHNFAFTSELHYIFTYQASVAASATPAVFNFVGDDDVWGFINNRLVIDLGGVHSPATGSYTLNTANAAALGLVDQGWYSIDLFQAEAHVCRSTYALTLSNFAHLITQCQNVCGDGIVEGSEVCDQGTKNGLTACSACTSSCTRGPYCGDALVQATCGEQCDDGVNLSTYGACGPGCKFAPYCGDGVVSNGEQCDNGTGNVDPATVPYGAGLCTTTCTVAPHCGDGIVQSPPEQCDDGVNNGTSGSKCDSKCMLKCGDALSDPSKQCDRGAVNNTGGYGGCNADCTLGPYCGDGVLQSPPEQCDYGTANNTGGYGGCNPGCTLGPYCGDGIVQSPPETCDNGANNVVPVAAYGKSVCTIACAPAPYCGDGIVQAQFGEQCDSTTDCNPMCQFLVPK
ncbi:MAG: DUF4215 domain-containing protein [Myxococcota bacterium]|nr:DUF4215 domain-containing protein [Myxococcota bacterium]